MNRRVFLQSGATQRAVQRLRAIGAVGAVVASVAGCVTTFDDRNMAGGAMGPMGEDVPTATVGGVAATGQVKLPVSRPVGESVQAWTSSHAMAGRSGFLYVADRERDQLVVLRQAPLEVVQKLPVAGAPQRLLVAPDGAVWVAQRNLDTVLRFAPTGKPEAPLAADPKKFSVGLEPRAMALAADGQTLYVGLGGLHEVVALNAVSGEKLATAAVSGAPLALAVADKMVVVSLDNGEIARLQTAGGKLTTDKAVMAASGASLVSTCADTGRKGRRALGAVYEPATQAVSVARVVAAPGTVEDIVTANIAEQNGKTKGGAGGYGGNGKTECFDGPRRPVEPSVITVRAATAKNPAAEMIGTPRRNPATLEALAGRFDQPADVAAHPTRRLLAMPATGTDNVLLMHAVDPGNAGALEAAELKTGQAPIAVAFSDDGRFAYTLDSQDIAVRVFDLGGWLKSGDAGASVSELPVIQSQTKVVFGEDVLPPNARLGRRTFTFAGNPSLSKAGTFACATCHADGGEDKLVWMVADGPRQTPALAGRLDGTGPFNWKGSEATLQHNMVKTVHRMGGNGLSDTELASLEQFLLVGLPKAPPNPNLAADGQLTAQQVHGKELFERADIGCAACHTGGTGTDGMQHDVGTGGIGDQMAVKVSNNSGAALAAGVFDTPSLKNLWNTAPYFHDGSAATLMDAIAKPTMGHASKLGAADRADLIAYLLTL